MSIRTMCQWIHLDPDIQTTNRCSDLFKADHLEWLETKTWAKLEISMGIDSQACLSSDLTEFVQKMYKMWLVGSCCSLATKQNRCKFWRVVKVQLFIESKERVTSRKCFRFLLLSVGRWSSQLPLKDYSQASFDFVRGFRKFKFLAELSFEFFYNSRLIRWIQQKNYDLLPSRHLL